MLLGTTNGDILISASAENHPESNNGVYSMGPARRSVLREGWLRMQKFRHQWMSMRMGIIRGSHPHLGHIFFTRSLQ